MPTYKQQLDAKLTTLADIINLKAGTSYTMTIDDMSFIVNTLPDTTNVVQDNYYYYSSNDGGSFDLLTGFQGPGAYYLSGTDLEPISFPEENGYYEYSDGEFTSMKYPDVTTTYTFTSGGEDYVDYLQENKIYKFYASNGAFEQQYENIYYVNSQSENDWSSYQMEVGDEETITFSDGKTFKVVRLS